MAGGGNFIHRVLSYVANELIVNGLANRVIDFVFVIGLSANDDFRRLVMIADMTAVFFTEFYRPRFQRFAVRTSKKMEEISDIAAQKKKELTEQMKDVSKNFDSFKKQ